MEKIIQVGEINNYYGGVSITKKGNKYYWIIEDHNTNFHDTEEWEEIPKSLYDELLKFYKTIKNEQEFRLDNPNDL